MFDHPIKLWIVYYVLFIYRLCLGLNSVRTIVGYSLDRRHLGNTKIKFHLFLLLRSICTIVDRVLDRLRFGKRRNKTLFFLAFALDLHYLCSNLGKANALAPKWHFICESVFSFILIRKIRQILAHRINKINAHACRLSTPRQGASRYSI